MSNMGCTADLHIHEGWSKQMSNKPFKASGLRRDFFFFFNILYNTSDEILKYATWVTSLSFTKPGEKHTKLLF